MARSQPPRDAKRCAEEILQALALRINFLTIAQVARTWCAGEAHPKKAARTVIEPLVRAGYVAPRLLLTAFPEQPITGPVFVWEPGGQAPDYEALSERLKARWKGLAWQKTTAFLVTAKGASSIPNGLEPTLNAQDENHDLHMSAVFLLLREQIPHWIPHWVSDRHYHHERGRPPGFQEKTPDALIRIGEWKRVIDFGGAYSTKKLETIHRWWSNERIAYELW